MSVPNVTGFPLLLYPRFLLILNYQAIIVVHLIIIALYQHQPPHSPYSLPPDRLLAEVWLPLHFGWQAVICLRIQLV